MFPKNEITKYKEVILFAIPAILESILVTLLTTVDTFMVSSLGTESVAAVALTTQPAKLLMVFFTALNVAITKNVAECMGRDDEKTAAAIVRFGFNITLAVSVAVAVLSICFADGIMKISGSNSDTHEMAVLYFRIIMAGMIPCNISLYINAVKRGMGNSRVSLVSNMSSNIVNVIFDYILIYGAFGIASIGVAGAALATDIGYFAAMVISLISLCSRKDFFGYREIIRVKEKGNSAALKKPFLVMTVTMFAELLLTRIAYMVVTAMTARIGTTALAVDKVAMNFLDVIFSFGTGLQAAAITMVGRSLGRGDRESIKNYAGVTMKLGFAISIVLFFAFFIFGGDFILLYFEETEEIAEYASMTSTISALIALVQIPQLIMNGVLRGLGQVKKTLIASVTSVLGVQIIFVSLFLYVFDLGLAGKWIGSLVSQTIWAVTLVLVFVKYIKKQQYDIEIKA